MSLKGKIWVLAVAVALAAGTAAIFLQLRRGPPQGFYDLEITPLLVAEPSELGIEDEDWLGLALYSTEHGGIVALRTGRAYWVSIEGGTPTVRSEGKSEIEGNKLCVQTGNFDLHMCLYLSENADSARYCGMFRGADAVNWIDCTVFLVTRSNISNFLDLQDL